MTKKPAKSETLTIRLDPKTRFMLEFVARLRGQTITTVVERAIAEAANRATIHVEDESSFGRNSDPIVHSWRDYWNISDGVRAINIARESELHPTYEEERRLAFCMEFWPFFFTDAKAGTMRTGYIDVLWPRIDEFIALHDASKTKDYFAAGKAMKTALLDAKIAPPHNWPPVSKGKASDLDEEIPF